jgi:hypothetical protein
MKSLMQIKCTSGGAEPMAHRADIAVVWVTLDKQCVLSGDGVNYFVTLRQHGKVVRQKILTDEATALAIADTWLEDLLNDLPRSSRESLRRHR